MGDRDDDIRRAILARRATFLAAAVAGVSLDACGGPKEPAPEIVTVPVAPATGGEATAPGGPARPRDEREADVVDAGAAPDDLDPRPCLSVAYVDPDAGAPAPRDAGAAKPARDAGAYPMPCLVPPLPPPHPTAQPTSRPPHPSPPPPLPHPLPQPCLSPRRM